MGTWGRGDSGPERRGRDPGWGDGNPERGVQRPGGGGDPERGGQGPREKGAGTWEGSRGPRVGRQGATHRDLDRGNSDLETEPGPQIWSRDAHQLADGAGEGGGDGAVGEGAVRGPAEAGAEQQQQQQRGLRAARGEASIGPAPPPPLSRLPPPAPFSLFPLSPFQLFHFSAPPPLGSCVPTSDHLSCISFCLWSGADQFSPSSAPSVSPPISPPRPISLHFCSLLLRIFSSLSIPLPLHAHLSCFSLDLGPSFTICTHLPVSSPDPYPSLPTPSISPQLCPSPPNSVHLPHPCPSPHTLSTPTLSISPLSSAHPDTALPFPHLNPQGYAQLGSRLAPALSFRPGAPHACGRILEGTEERVSDPRTPAPSLPAPPAPSPPRPSPSPPLRPSLGPLMWLSFRLLLYRASCVKHGYGENSSSLLLRTPTSGACSPPRARDPGIPPPPLSAQPQEGDPGPALRGPGSPFSSRTRLPQLGVEGATPGDSQRSKVKGNIGGR